jgi:hypothetical protein
MLKKQIIKIPVNRLMSYLLLLGTVPVLLALYSYQLKKKEWESVWQQISWLRDFSTSQARKQSINQSVKAFYKGADTTYLEIQLESLLFLKKEREALERLINSPTFTGNESAENRYALLTSKANSLAWVQGRAQEGEGIEQIELSLTHPVEVDIQDVKEILSRIEGNRKGKPQLIITDFKLQKKQQSTGSEVFELNLKILKREFRR